MNISKQEIIDHFKITDDEREALSMLSSELWNGPYYIVDNEENAFDTITLNDVTIHFGDYTSDGIIGDAFPTLLEMNEPLIERLKESTYYEPDSGCFMNEEPKPYFDEELFKEDHPDEPDDDEIRNRYWEEPTPYYELELRDILEILHGSRTASEMVYHF